MLGTVRATPVRMTVKKRFGRTIARCHSVGQQCGQTPFSTFPTKYDALLVVDSQVPVFSPVATQFLEAIARRRAKVFERLHTVEYARSMISSRII